MLQRKIEKEIIKWFENSNKALLIDGLSKVGKTYVIRKTFKSLGINAPTAQFLS